MTHFDHFLTKGSLAKMTIYILIESLDRFNNKIYAVFKTAGYSGLKNPKNRFKLRILLSVYVSK
jgi:hypothetical protein